MQRAQEVGSLPFGGDEKVQMGTTIMAITIQGGVILAADSRTSRGKFVSNRGAAKLTQLAKNVAVCRSGAAADTQAMAAMMQHYLSHQQIEFGAFTPVAVAAHLFQSIVYQNKARLSAGIILGGWDDDEEGSVYALPMGGTLLKVPYALGGSGSSYISGFVDKHWRAGMTAQEGRAFCISAVTHASSRDGSSGGCVRMVRISKDGYYEEFVPHTETPQAYGELPFPRTALLGGPTPMQT